MWNMATRGRSRPFEAPPAKGARNEPVYILSFAVSADGRRSASCQSDGGVTAYETASGQILEHFHGHRGGAVAVNLTANGDRILSGGGDHPVLVWDASLKKLGGGAGPLPAAERDKAWDRLGTQSAKEAIKTMAALAADPDGTVALFAMKLRPLRAPDSALLDRIFRDLDDADFEVRAKVAHELNQLDEGALGAIRERLAKAPLALEVRRRAERFVSRFEAGDIVTPERLRIERAMEVLAAVNTSASQKLVETLAAGAPGAWLTDAARRTVRGNRPETRRP